jgi:hypothetical protein
MKGTKRSMSKPKENVIKKSPALNKNNIITTKPYGKDSQPVLSKNALDLIDKISDEKFNNIRNQMEKDSKKSTTKIVGKVQISRKLEHENNSFNNSKNGDTETGSNGKVKVLQTKKINYNQQEYENFVKKIQRWFRKILMVFKYLN